MAFGKTAAAHDRGGDGNLRGLGEFLQFGGRLAGNDAAAAIEHGALGFFDQSNDFIQGEVVGLQIGLGIDGRPF